MRGQQLVPSAQIPAPLILVDEHLRDEDLTWVNEQLDLIGDRAIRGPRDIPLPPPTGGAR
jgi:hypothetical protein